MPLVKRLVKGSELTWAEGDGNIDALDASQALRILEQKGAVFSGASSSAADTAAIQALIDEYAAGDSTRKPRIVLPNPAELGFSVIVMNAGLTLNMSKIGGFDGNGNQLDFSSLTSGAALTITGSAGSGNDLYDQIICTIQNLRLLGNSEAGSVTALNFTAGAGLAGAQGIVLRDIIIKQFGLGEVHAANTYLVKHFNIGYYSCGLAFRSISGGNRGENLQWYGGAIGNSSGGFELGACGAYVYGMSIDYNAPGPVVALSGDGEFNMFGGWIESNNLSGPWFTGASANGVSLHLHGVKLLCIGTTPHALAEFFSFAVPSRATLHNCFFSNFRNTNECLALTGFVTVHGSSFYTTSQMPYNISNSYYASLMLANAESSAWEGQVRDAANWAGRLTGANLVAAVSATTAKSGTNSMRFTKTNGAGASAIFDMYCPITSEMVMSLGVWDRDIGDVVTGTYLIETDWVTASKNENGLWEATQVSAMTDTGTIAPNDTWAHRGIRPDGYKPRSAWCTHLRVSFNFTALGNGAIYLDELYVNGW